MLGTSDAWLMSRLSHPPSDQAYYTEDCRILGLELAAFLEVASTVLLVYIPHWLQWV